jgi:uncharacterized protein DUF3108
MSDRHSSPPRPKNPVRRASLIGACIVAGLSLLTLGASTDSTLAAVDTVLTANVQLPPAPEVVPAVNHPFRAGESLKFSVQYGPIHAGSAYLEVAQSQDVGGHPTLLLQARAESNGFFSAFYKVRNRIQSYWDSDGGFTRRYVENRREGGFRAKDQIEFDYDKLEARYQDGRSYPIPPHVQDALSSFYFARMQSLPLGGSFVFDYHASRKSQPLEVRVLGRERVETPAGKFNCVAIEPKLKAGGIFKNKGQLVIWITEDERRMPVLMRSKVTIGSISVVLQEYKAGT